MTNYDPESVQDIMQQLVDIAGANGGFLGDVHISDINGNVLGLAYTDSTGMNHSININLSNVNLTDPNAIINVIYHETTNFESHDNNEITAQNRGDTAEGIFDLKNYGNENTNSMTGEDWYDDNKGHIVLGKGNYDYYENKVSNLNNPSSSSQNYYDIKTGTIDKESDTWESVTREINDFYGTNLTVDELKKINESEEFELGDSIVAGTVIKTKDEDGNDVEVVWQVEYDKDKIDLGYWGDLNSDQKQITHYQRDNFYDETAEKELGKRLEILDNPNASANDKQEAQAWIDARYSNEGPTGTHNVGISENLDENQRNQDYRGIGGDNNGQQFIWTPGYVDSVTNEYIAGSFDRSDVNGGTYDYIMPDNSIGGHLKMDVDPWLAWGNKASDRGNLKSILERREGLTSSSYGFGDAGFQWYINGEEGSLYDKAIMERLRIK